MKKVAGGPAGQVAPGSRLRRGVVSLHPAATLSSVPCSRDDVRHDEGVYGGQLGQGVGVERADPAETDEANAHGFSPREW